MIAHVAALKGRPFRLLWSGQTISALGNQLYQVALAWWVLEQTGSATLMGSILICSMIPMLLFVLLGGVVVDRLPRARLMIVCELARGLICLGVTVLAATQQLEVWHILVASALFGIVDALFQPASSALIPEITPPEARASANALMSLSLQVGRVAGPMLGAALIATGGSALAFALDAASFFISAALLLPLYSHGTRPAAHAASMSVVAQIREGIVAVFGTRWLAITIGVLALTNVTLGGPFQVALPFLVEEHFGGDVQALGRLYAAFGLGYVVGAVWLGRRGQIRRRGWLLYGMLIVAGLGMLALGLPIGIAGALIAAVVNGAALEVANLTYLSAVQELVPDEWRGRVASVEMLGTYSMIPLGSMVAGWGTNTLGAATVCVIGGLATALVAALGLLHPAIRKLE
jgi:MFS family permease